MFTEGVDLFMLSSFSNCTSYASRPLGPAGIDIHMHNAMLWQNDQPGTSVGGARWRPVRLDARGRGLLLALGGEPMQDGDAQERKEWPGCSRHVDARSRVHACPGTSDAFALGGFSDGLAAFTDTRGPLLCPRPSPRARALSPRPQTRPEAVNFFSLGADGDGAGGGASSSGTSTEAAATWTHAGRAPTLTDCKGDAKVWTPEAISFFTLREAIENEGMKEASREELGRSSGSAWAHSTMVSSFLYASPLMVPARVFS